MITKEGRVIKGKNRFQQIFSPYFQALGEDLNLLTMGGLIGVSVITWSWLPLLVGGGAEALYLLFLPESKFYKGVLSGREARLKQKRMEELKMQTLKYVNKPERIRYQKLEDLKNDIDKTSSEESGMETRLLMGEDLQKLEYLLTAFLKLLATLSRFREHLQETDDTEIKKDLARLSQQMEGTSDPLVKEVIEKNIEILQKRLEQYVKIRDSSKRIEAQLEAIEDAFKLVKDQLMAMQTPGQVSQDLNDLVSGVEATEQIIETTAPMMEKIQRLGTV